MSSDYETPHGYPALRLTSTILGGLAIAGVLSGIALAFMILTDRIAGDLSRTEAVVAVVLSVLVFGSFGLGLLAYSELLRVVVDTERNTRRTYELLEDLVEDYIEE